MWYSIQILFTSKEEKVMKLTIYFENGTVVGTFECEELLSSHNDIYTAYGYSTGFPYATAEGYSVKLPDGSYLGLARDGIEKYKRILDAAKDTDPKEAYQNLKDSSVPWDSGLTGGEGDSLADLHKELIDFGLIARVMDPKSNKSDDELKKDIELAFNTLNNLRMFGITDSTFKEIGEKYEETRKHWKASKGPSDVFKEVFQLNDDNESSNMIDSVIKFKEDWDRYVRENIHYPRNLMKDYIRFSSGLSDDLEEFDKVEFPTILFGSPALVTLEKFSMSNGDKVNAIRGSIHFAFVYHVGIDRSTKDVKSNGFIPLDSYICCSDSDIYGDADILCLYNKEDETYSVLYRSIKDLVDWVKSYCGNDLTYNVRTQFTVPLTEDYVTPVTDTICYIENAINDWCTTIYLMVSDVLVSFEDDCIKYGESKTNIVMDIPHIEAAYLKILGRNYELDIYEDIISKLTKEFVIYARKSIVGNSAYIFDIVPENDGAIYSDYVKEFDYSLISKMLVHIISYLNDMVEQHDINE